MFTAPPPVALPAEATPAAALRPPPSPSLGPAPAEDDPFARAAAVPSDDPFLAAARRDDDPFGGPGPEDDPFARAALAGEVSTGGGNFALADAAFQAPAPGIASPTPSPYAAPAAYASPAPFSPAGLDALALEDSARPAALPAAFGEAADPFGAATAPPEPPLPPASGPPPPAPGALDFGAFDFGDAGDEPLGTAAPPPPVAGARASQLGGVDPLAGLSLDDLEGPPAAEAALPPPDPLLAVHAAAEDAPVEPLPGPAPRLPPPAADPRVPRRPLRLGSLALNALSLAALLLVAGALLASWRGRSAGPSAGTPPPLAAVRVSSILYEALAGPVLVVRGEVRSGHAPVAAPTVAVELLDGGRVVASGRAAAGALPSPEEVHAVDGAPAAARLAAEVAARAPARLAAGETAPFAAVLAGLPAGAERFTVRVTVAPGGESP